MSPRRVRWKLVALLVVAACAVRVQPAGAVLAPAFDVAAPSRTGGATVARIVAPSFARAQLAVPRRGRRVGTATAWSGQPQTLLVLDGATRDGAGWVKVLLADRPNGSAGWVPRDNVTLGSTRYWVEVAVRSRTVTVFRGGRRVLRTRAVVGAPRTPTPLGLAAIYERNRQPDPRGFLGPWALSLTSLSNVLESFGGGPGRVAIHGRAGESFADPLGSARSHGCVRIDNGPIAWMAKTLPIGTPVHVTGS
ncbi:L,D-transpeptidase [Conexibacter stalactiti]|uniref:L,D-transpeptidase n=1 Tax=Conexibacter stalactiti TaxID=1940611 RepID=A0ABU4HMP2_9ACTN|nr:L,D-transpeptidase [Conexibacter stalactiti]MDW5593825.1 L,D-transpeptidase [Conexibacter stalactiti]MEC5034467.1 L,D-transpeptidase [Conexibacter stalactiti]